MDDTGMGWYRYKIKNSYNQIPSYLNLFITVHPENRDWKKYWKHIINFA